MSIDPLDLEYQHVHQVYQEIASHFSDTRYKPWPIVERYLSDLPSGSIGVDIGCGNGKYLNVNKNLYIIGSDRSSELVKIAQGKKNGQVAVADALAVPFPSDSFDFAISIAVIHHFSTRQRRIKAVEEIIRLLKSQGTALIYVWALEQKNSRRGWDEGMDQDVMVPWVLNEKKKKKPEEAQATENESEDNVKLRYYHLYKKGELEEDVSTAGGIVIEQGYEKDNWWAVVQRKSL
jgi:tRNA (uracil-5-)-methyltransferase TRM9